MDQDNNQPITPSDLSSDSASINKRLVLEDEVQTETQDDRVIKKSKVSQDEESSMHFHDLEEYNEESDRDWVEGQEEEEEESDTDSIESLLAHPALFRDDDSLVDVDNIEEEEVQKGKHLDGIEPYSLEIIII
ncbi:hypothetical protein RMATCC62417_13067 [Rhizopus microsporus]|nr:hypothetical protein RMATCC62417_13067 [Rhizopus microsporus]